MRKSYVVPTHLRTPETILTLGGVSLSVRQFFLLLLGAAFSYDLWLHAGLLATFPGGQVLRGLLAVVPALVAIALASVRIAGRGLDRWLLVVLLYRLRPKRLVWRSVRFMEPQMIFGEQTQEEEKYA